MKKKKTRRTGPTITETLKDLSQAVNLLRLSFHPLDLQKLCQQAKELETATNQMRNRLDGIEVAVAKLLPSHLLEALPQFRNASENKVADYLL